MNIRTHCVSACALHAVDSFHFRQLEAYRIIHSALTQGVRGVSVSECVVSYEEFLCMLSHALDMASHIQHLLRSGGAWDPRQADLLATMLITVCGACAHVSRVACMREGVGAAPALGFRVPAADSMAYVPTSLGPFGYDFMPFGVLHGGGAAPSLVPDGPERPPRAGESLFKHSVGSCQQHDNDHGCSDPLPYPFEPAVPLDPEPVPPVWDHALLPFPLPSGCTGPVPVRVARAWGDQPPGEGSGGGGARADARDASHFIRGGPGGGGEPPRGVGAPSVAPVAAGGEGPGGPSGGDPVVPPGGQRDNRALVRWTSVVRPPVGEAGPLDDPWPPLGSTGCGRRRRRDDGPELGGGRRVRF
jgi:hypothetical protein